MIDGDVAYICKCQEQRRMERLFKASKITPAFRKKTFSNFDPKGCPEIVQDMYECTINYTKNFKALDENNWLVLLGEPGCGKTHLSMAAANNLLAKGFGVLYFQHVEGISELKDSLRQAKDQDTKEERLAARLDGMKKVEILVWDDLFKGRKSPRDFDLEVAFEVLNYRYLNLLPTIISSERTPENLIEIDKAIARRIIERSKGHMIVIEGMEANYSLRGGR